MVVIIFQMNGRFRIFLNIIMFSRLFLHFEYFPQNTTVYKNKFLSKLSNYSALPCWILNFSSLPFNIKLRLLLIKLLSLFTKLFTNCSLLSERGKRKTDCVLFFKQPWWYYWKIFQFLKSFYNIINELLRKACRNTFWNSLFGFYIKISFYLFCSVRFIHNHIFLIFYRYLWCQVYRKFLFNVELSFYKVVSSYYFPKSLVGFISSVNFTFSW